LQRDRRGISDLLMGSQYGVVRRTSRPKQILRLYDGLKQFMQARMDGVYQSDELGFLISGI